MKNSVTLFLLFCAIVLANSSSANVLGITRDTFSKVQCDSLPYSISKGVSLMMSVYQPVGDQSLNRPLIIMAHGGSFIHGNRKSDRLVELCSKLAKQGYVAVSIEYRLCRFSGMISKKNAYKNIMKAVADGRACVQWFLRSAAHGNAWKVDTSNIFFGGISAGAILAEHVGFIDGSEKGSLQLRNAEKLYLPDSTANVSKHIRGIISLAGAVLDTAIIHGPMAILHVQGDADRIVPYNHKHVMCGFAPYKMSGLGACRNIYLAKHLSFQEYVFKGKGHVSWNNNEQEFEIVKAQVLQFLAKEIR